MGVATTLTTEQIADLRAAARRTGSIINPAALHTVTHTRFYPDWATAVLGRPYPGIKWVAPWEITLLAAALAAEPDRPIPDEVLARRHAYEREQAAKAREMAARQAAAEADWRALRARLPVPVTVGHNWTIGHWESGHVTGKDHIVVQADLHVGRLHRPKRAVLCETPAQKKKRATNGTSRDPLRGVDRDDDGQDRVPTCRACLKTARRIAAPSAQQDTGAQAYGSLPTSKEISPDDASPPR